MSATTACLGEILHINTRSLNPAIYPDREFHLFSIPGFDNGRKPEYVTGNQIGSNKHQIASECILVSKINPRIKRIWRVTNPVLNGSVCSTEFIQLIPKRIDIDLRFIEHFLIHTDLERLTATASQAATKSRQRFQPRAILSIPISLPSVAEQRRVVGLLDRAAEIRRRAEAARAKARAIIPALFLDTFGDPASNWPVHSIDEVLAKQKGSIRTGPFGSQLKHSEFTEYGIPVLGIDNAVENQFRWAKPRHLPPEKYSQFKRFRVYPCDVIITIMGTTGRVCVAPDDLPECMSTKHLCVLSLDALLIQSRYLWGALLFDPSVRSQARGHGQIMEGWNISIVRGLRLRLPPLDLQSFFAEQVRRIEMLSRNLDMAAAKAEAMAAALSAEVFEAGSRRGNGHAGPEARQ